MGGESLNHVEIGWMGGPLPIDNSGNVRTYGNGPADTAFRFVWPRLTNFGRVAASSTTK